MEKVNLVDADLPERITAGPCSRCGSMLVGMNVCPYCGAGWVGTRVEYVRADIASKPDSDERCPHCGHDFIATNPEVYDCRVAPYLDMGDPVICGCDNDFHLAIKPDPDLISRSTVVKRLREVAANRANDAKETINVSVRCTHIGASGVASALADEFQAADKDKNSV